MYVKRDLYMRKETCICEKRPVYVTSPKSQFATQSRPICEKRELYMRKETYI